MRLIFMGTPEFAIPSLKALIDAGEEILLVVTQPDKPKGRGLKLAYPPVKELALKYNLPLEQPQNIKDAEFIEKIKLLQPDIIIIVAYGKILPKELLKIPKYGCFNVHASLLPKYRGAAPIPYAILNDETETGVSIMKLDEKMDSGPVVLQEKLKIADSDTAGTLAEKLAVLGAKALIKSLHQLEDKSIKYIDQDHTSATYAPALKKEDGRILWTNKAEQVYNHVKAMNPWPGAYTFWQGKRLKIWEAGPVKVDLSKAHAGMIAKIEKDGFIVGTGEGFIKILNVQLEGGRLGGVAEFLKGHKIHLQEVLG